MRRKDGTAFMAEYDPARKDLAPRDIVARAIDSEIKKTGDECVYLDVTHLSPEEIKSHFPTIYARCLSFGIDITTDWIPVVPAAHYSCGGVRTDLLGRTTIDAPVRLRRGRQHGRPRREPPGLQLPAGSAGLRQARRRGRRARTPPPGNAAQSVADFPGAARRIGVHDHAQVARLRHRLQTVMQKYVGIVRTDSRLPKAAAAVAALRAEAQASSTRPSLADDVLELRNMIEVAALIIACAQRRKESRGLHYNTDYPETRESERHDTVLKSARPGAETH